MTMQTNTKVTGQGKNTCKACGHVSPDALAAKVHKLYGCTAQTSTKEERLEFHKD